jgi:hypothetical protein
MGVSTNVDIANIALQRLGQPTISTLTESSRDATICNQLFAQNRDYCLMLADWDCLINRRKMSRSGQATISGISRADPGVITLAATHTFVTNELIYVESCAGMTQINETGYRVAAYTSLTITLGDLDGSTTDTSSYTAWTSGGYVYRNPTPNWAYVYDLPTDSLKVMGVFDEEGAMVDAMDKNYQWVKERTFIFTNLENAGVKFLKQETDPSLYNSDLVEVIASRLAWYISMRIHADKELRMEIYNEMNHAIQRAKMTNATGSRDGGEEELLWVNANAVTLEEDDRPRR